MATSDYDLCDICGRAEYLHTGPEKFCAIYATYRPAKVAPLSSRAAPEKEQRAIDFLCRQADHLDTEVGDASQNVRRNLRLLAAAIVIPNGPVEEHEWWASIAEVVCDDCISPNECAGFICCGKTGRTSVDFPRSGSSDTTPSDTKRLDWLDSETWIQFDKTDDSDDDTAVLFRSTNPDGQKFKAQVCATFREAIDAAMASLPDSDGTQ